MNNRLSSFLSDLSRKEFPLWQKRTRAVADAACRRITGPIRNESSFLHPPALSAVSLRLLSTYEGFDAFIGAFCHPRHFFAAGCRSQPPFVWIFTRHQTKKPTEDCLSPRKTTTIISVFSHKWWKRRGIKAPPFFLGAALDAGNRFFPSIESGKNR